MSEKKAWYTPFTKSLINTSEIIFLTSSLLAIGIIVYDSINDLRNTNQTEWTLLVIVDIILIGYFITILADSHYKSENRVEWWKWNSLQIIALFPLLGTAIPGLGGAGVLRFLLLIPAIQAILRMLNIAEGDEVSVQKRITHLFIIVSILTLAGAVLTLMFELQYEDECIADPTCNDATLVVTFDNSIWYAIETITTVGYGEYYPHSVGARVVATILLFVGIGMFGTLAATLSQLFFSDQMWRNKQREDFIAKLHLLTELHDKGDLSDSQFESAKRRLTYIRQDDEQGLMELDAATGGIARKKSIDISVRKERLDEAKQFFSEIAENGDAKEKE